MKRLLFCLLIFLPSLVQAAPYAVEVGATNVMADIFIQDASYSDGRGLSTPLTYQSVGLSCYYHRDTAAAAVAITLADATVGTFTSGGFKVVDNTNMPGVYQLHIPDAAFVSGANEVVIKCRGATNMVPRVFSILIGGTSLVKE